MLRTRAQGILRQRALYEHQRDGAEAKARNLEQQQQSLAALEDTRLTAEATRSAHASMARQTASPSLSLDDIAETVHAMKDLMSDQNEIDNILTEPFDSAGGNELMDDGALDAELDALMAPTLPTPPPPSPTRYPNAPSSEPQQQGRRQLDMTMPL